MVDDLSRSPDLLGREGDVGFEAFESLRIKGAPGPPKFMDVLVNGFFRCLEGAGRDGCEQ